MPGLDQVDAGRFERLEEPAGEPDRNDILDPRLLAVPGLEAKQPRLGKRRPVEVREEVVGGFIVADMRARIHVAVARPVLERDPPLPAGSPRGRASQRLLIVTAFARHRDRAVARQPFGPILEAGFELLLDKQPAEARAVDEKVAFDAASIGQQDSLHEPRFRVLDDVDDAPFRAPDAQRLGTLPQILRIQGCVELERIGDPRQRRTGLIRGGVRKAAAEPGDDAERIDIERSRIARHAAFEPMVVKFDPQHIEPVEAERVDVAVTDPRPVAELDAELVSGVGRTDEVALVDPEERVEQIDLGNCRLADADGPDLIRFHQLDRKVGHFAENVRHRCRGHPAGGPAADDDHPADSVTPHRMISAGCAAALVAAQHWATNSSCVGMRCAVSSIAMRICSSACATLFSSSPSTTGS